MKRQTRNTWIFALFFLIAGFANLFSRTGDPAWDSLMCSVNYVIYIGMLLYWIEAVRYRLLPSGAGTCIKSASFLMLAYMLVRIFKYRIALSPAAMRYAVYAYWIPQMLIPALFLTACIRISRGGQGKRKDDLIMIPSVIMFIIALTNDLHFLVYVPKIPVSAFAVDTGTYTYGPVFYLMYVWMILTGALGLFMLFRTKVHMPVKAVLFFAGDIVLWFGLVLLKLLAVDILDMAHMYNVPELHIFGMLGIFEICIRYRLIPCNENYAGFFGKLQIPAVITDRGFHYAFISDAAGPIEHAVLQEALHSPVSLDDDWKLYGKEIRSGYAFWAEDESAVHRMQEKLLEANEMISQENDLIRAETEQKEKDAFLQSRHRIYHEIAEKLYPVQKRISGILDQAECGTDDFRKKIAEVSVLNAYVKRKTNLLLLAEENETLSLTELFIALQESASYLTLAGLQTTAGRAEDKDFPAGVIIALYDIFECIAEQLIGKAPSLMVSWNKQFLRLAAETDALPDTEGISLPVRFLKSEDILYVDILAVKDGKKS